MADGKRYVVGDVHGCARSFRSMISGKIKLKKEDTLFLLGDYIDRGPDSKGVLDIIMELQRENYNVKPIMGNHGYMLLQSLEDEAEFENWKKNGSLQTLTSFGIPEDKANEPNSVHLIPPLYIDFLRQMRFFEETEDFYFVHAGIVTDGSHMVMRHTSPAGIIQWAGATHYTSRAKFILHESLDRHKSS